MIRTFLAAGVVTACLAACSSPASPPGPVVDITVSTGALVPPFSPDVFNYEVTSLTTLVPVDITVVGQDTTIDGHPAQDNVAQRISVPSLDDTTEIRIQATDARGLPVTYNIRTAPQNRARYDVTTLASPTPGLIFLSPFQSIGATGGPAFLYILDETGKLVYYAETPFGPTDFERVKLPSGDVRYTYLMQDGPLDVPHWPIEPTTAYVLDDHFQKLQTIKLAAAGTHPAFGVDVHEFRLFDDNHWMVESYIPELIHDVPRRAQSMIVSGIVQEVNDGNVVFDWETTSVPHLLADSTEGNDFSNTSTPWADAYHLNSMDIDPSNGNVLVSLRHDDEVVELDHKTGAIVWTLGGASDDFGLAPADKFSHEHHARFIAPNDITMFDNGNSTQLTKVREYLIDPVAHTAQVVAAISIDNHFSTAMGSVQKIDGRYFVGWGYRRPNESDVTEIDATTHEKTFELSFHDGYCSYRALKFQP
jgi:arylsulfate sulfotransferase